MTESRSASQILFGYLPEQTVDIRGGVWRVRSWRNTAEERNVDSSALAREILRIAAPWQQTGLDGGLSQDLLTQCARVHVRRLDRDAGIEVVPFPRVWICRGCDRICRSPDERCVCGATARKGQLHFVGFCERCGALEEPWISECPIHHQVRITFPGTTSGSEIVFSCPVCERVLKRGFIGPTCSCGARLSYNVHRSASVYTPRSVVLVNPPSPEKMRQIEAAGGKSRALEWVLEGMTSMFLSSQPPTAQRLVEQLRAQGFSEDVIAQMTDVARSAGALSTKNYAAALPEAIRTEAEAEALTIAFATAESRCTSTELLADLRVGPPALQRYGERLDAAIRRAALDRVDFLDRFPVLTGHFGYTRGPADPGASRLRAFREPTGDYVVYGEISETEALFLQLSAERVATWLQRCGYALPAWTDRTSAQLAVLTACGSGTPVGDLTAAERVFRLVHSFTHRFIRLAAVHAGIERNALSELLVPHLLGAFVYASAKGDFVLGGLQAVFETELDRLLEDVTSGDHRCPLDPGCTRGGGACIGCLHLGEPSCRHFNTRLSRSVLHQTTGLFDLNPSASTPS